MRNDGWYEEVWTIWRAILGKNFRVFIIKLVHNANAEIYKKAKLGAVRNCRFYDPIANEDISIASLRGDRKDENGNTVYGLKQWESTDIVPRKDDLFQERLYCIRYVELVEDIDDDEVVCNLQRGRTFRESNYSEILFWDSYTKFSKKPQIPLKISVHLL